MTLHIQASRPLREQSQHLNIQYVTMYVFLNRKDPPAALAFILGTAANPCYESPDNPPLREAVSLGKCPLSPLFNQSKLSIFF